MTLFYLGSHLPSWLGKTGVPLCISRRRLCTLRTFPRAWGRWVLDSGGFSELSLYGVWTVSPSQYVSEVRRWRDEIGKLDWAAIQDWMCEPWILAKTGLTIREHQTRTLRSYLELREAAPEIPWLPVLQGYTVQDYLTHLDQYARANVDLTQLPVVGIGSVCRRQATNEAAHIICTVAAEKIRLHGFGIKLQGLALCASYLTSADSMAWSFAARRERRPLEGCIGHINCANCLVYAIRWRARTIHLLSNA